MELVDIINVGDTVVLTKDLLGNLSFKRYIVENIYESGEKYSPYHYSYILQGNYLQYYRHEIQRLPKLPVLKIRIADGEYDTYKNYIEQNKDYLDTRKINIAIARHDSNLVTIEFNFEDIIDFYYLSSDIGRFLQLDEQGIKEREALSLQRRVDSMREEMNFNRRHGYQEDNYYANEDYDTDGMRKDDEYNPKNWQGHDD